MNEHIFFTTGNSSALSCAVQVLKRKGCPVTTAPTPSVTHLLLPVPSFETDGTLKGGEAIKPILNSLPKNITVLGGNLNHPELENYRTVDFLQNPVYLAENAAITAHCALKVAMNKLPVTLQGCPVLVIGWGRIGKCLAALLKQLGARVCVAARKEADRAMLLALGYEVLDIPLPDYSLERFRVIFNTVPLMVLPESSLSFCRPECLKIDLASKPGIAGADVIWARGLPNKDAPETSGELIARTALRLKGV